MKKMAAFRLEESTIKLLDTIARESCRSRANVVEVLILKEAKERSLSLFKETKPHAMGLQSG